MALIDISAATMFGNMTTPSLNNHRDGNTGTYSYYANTDGWTGCVLTVATPIISAQIDSADNGFDASGLSTSITIDLYGKSTSGAPSTVTDGTLLATTTFTDVESITTKTLTPSDTSTLFYSVWFRVRTGVWAVASEIRFYNNSDSTIKKAAGVIRASLKKVAGVVIASIKKISGVQ